MGNDEVRPGKTFGIPRRRGQWGRGGNTVPQNL